MRGMRFRLPYQRASLRGYRWRADNERVEYSYTLIQVPGLRTAIRHGETNRRRSGTVEHTGRTCGNMSALPRFRVQKCHGRSFGIKDEIDGLKVKSELIRTDYLSF